MLGVNKDFGSGFDGRLNLGCAHRPSLRTR
jgi:hypothetical protein